MTREHLTIYVNGHGVVEPYRKTQALGQPVQSQSVRQGMLYVMGDNRTNSADSRVFGQIAASSVVGRSFVKIWPLQHWELIAGGGGLVVIVLLSAFGKKD